MKRMMSVVLVIIILLSITACAQSQQVEAPQEERAKIYLNNGNFHTYFNINSYCDNFTERVDEYGRGTDYYGNCNLHVTIEPIGNIEIIEPIEIQLNVSNVGKDNWQEDYWQVDGLQLDGSHMTITLPPTGEYNKIYSCSIKTVYETRLDERPKVSFLEVLNGTIYVG